jgi:hypothetical protein
MMMLLMTFLLLISPLGAKAHAENQGCAKIIRISGTVEIQKKNIKGSFSGLAGLLLSPEDTLKTDINGLCVLAFDGGNEIAVNGKTSIALRSGSQIDLIEGQVSAQLRRESRFSIMTANGEVTPKEADTEVIVSCSKSDHTTTCIVLSGDALFSNTLGNLPLTSLQRGLGVSCNVPRQGKNLSEKELEEQSRWINFGRPSLVVFIHETLLGASQKESLIQEDLEKLLEAGHFQVIGRGAIRDFGDSSMANLKKSAYGGDSESARTLAGEVEAQIYLVGAIRTALLGEVGKGIVSCSVQGQIKGYLTRSGELLFAHVVNNTSIQKSPQDASRDAMEKVLRELGDTLIWDLNQNLADLVKPIEEIHQITVLVYHHPLLGKKVITERLKRVPSIIRISPGKVGKEKDLYTILTSLPVRTIAPMLVSPENDESVSVDAKTQRITLKIAKKKEEK